MLKSTTFMAAPPLVVVTRLIITFHPLTYPCPLKPILAQLTYRPINFIPFVFNQARAIEDYDVEGIAIRKGFWIFVRLDATKCDS